MITCQGCQDIINKFEIIQSLSQEAFLVFEHIGIQQCSRECLLRTNCKAVAYNLEHLNCYLGDNNTYITTSSNQEEIASTRTILMEFEGQLLKSCVGHSCDESSVCVEMSTGTSECASWFTLNNTSSELASTTVSATEMTAALTTIQGQNPVECGDPPIVVDATTPISNDRSIGTVLSYSCQAGLIAKGDTETTCESDGQWSTLSMNCIICDTTFYVFAESLNFCYRIENSQRNTYADAILHCNTMNGKLAKLDTIDKINTVLVNLNVQVYVDGTDEAEDGTWVYSDSTAVNMDLFKLGAPSLGDTNCLTLRSDLGQTLDISCTLKKYSICEQV
ncbi:uncharacterized protein LOC132548808 [Ylistrum balloti]|uniref:uncharacterized protein LOC132548808 n=1 Tax=Ylistrum balloti TaxID=509963 RepID=UPI002905F627|nr:uncharacterized protein LOC132548808 [Ylistrum balloti]